MASETEIHRVRKDPSEWRLLVKQLLRYGETLFDCDYYFLRGINKMRRTDELTYRQMVWVFDIRDKMQTVTLYRGYSTKTLIRICYENRFDINVDEDEEAGIVTLYESGRTALRGYEAARLHAWAKRLGEVDNWAA